MPDWGIIWKRGRLGTAGVAAKMARRKCVGIDKEENYLEQTLKRIETKNEGVQMKLNLR